MREVVWSCLLFEKWSRPTNGAPNHNLAGCCWDFVEDGTGEHFRRKEKEASGEADTEVFREVLGVDEPVAQELTK